MQDEHTQQEQESTSQPQATPQPEPAKTLDPIQFNDLPTPLREAMARAGWSEMTPVQAGAIPYFFARRDVMAQAKTGSGKTGAYLLPMLKRINFNKAACQMLVLVPTRELAQQVTAEANLLFGDSGLRVAAVYGGTSYRPQIDAFKAGAHLVVATPGRVIDHLIKRNLTLDDLEVLVFDEADRMLSMGFYPDMVRIREFLPRRRYNSYMFSATFPAQVMRLTKQFLHEADFLSLSKDTVHVTDTRHTYVITPAMDKDRALVRLIEMENPAQAIIFCNTKDQVFYVTRVLQRFGYNADEISSDLSQNARDKVLKHVRDGKLRFLVATDVAARGIDIPELSHVFQYEPPEDIELYIHRAGRTGRAGAAGTAVMLVNALEQRMVTRIGAFYKIEFEQLPLPEDEDVQSVVAQRLVGRLEARLRDRDRLQVERMQRMVPLVRELAEDEDGVALLAMLLDDDYHAWMHQPPELVEVEDAAPPKKHESGGKSRRGGRRRR
ncbi:MAG: DEAD/DEAH box helicase [Anaerolineae bacterium]|nr:DEAD/DEAH box helicase [Anaerolineae bacterium]